MSETIVQARPMHPPGVDLRARAEGAADALDAALARRPLWLALSLLFVSAWPDTMVVPLLNELFVGRYGVSSAAAHGFMSVNLVGGLCAIPLLAALRRRLTPGVVLMLAALASAPLLAVMYLPIGFAATIGVRFVEGAADLIVFAVLFDLVAKAGPRATRGRRLGLAGTILMLGLFTGAVIGGVVGGGDAPAVFLVGATAMFMVAVVAAAALPLFRALIRSCPAVSDSGDVVLHRRPLWPPLVMVFGDRAIAGLMTATLPLYFASVAGLGPMSRGWLIGVPLLLMAFGAWPMGAVGDRIGHLRLRTFAAVLYAAAIASIPFVVDAGQGAMLAAMVLVGLAGAALLPTVLSLTTATGGGSVAMGAYRAAGDVGYLLGIAGAGAMLALAGGESAAAFTIVILTFAAAHAAITLISILTARSSPAAFTA